jgi:hypothetical protein
MSHLAGITLVKNAAGRTTHIKLSKKYFKELVEDMEDAIAIKKARRGDYISWDEARKKINKKFGFKD